MAPCLGCYIKRIEDSHLTYSDFATIAAHDSCFTFTVTRLTDDMSRIRTDIDVACFGGVGAGYLHCFFNVDNQVPLSCPVSPRPSRPLPRMPCTCAGYLDYVSMFTMKFLYHVPLGPPFSLEMCACSESIKPCPSASAPPPPLL